MVLYICVGIELDTVGSSWESMIFSAKQQGTKVILLTPTGDQRSDLFDPDDPLNRHAEQIRSLARKHEVALVDSLKSFKGYIQSGGALKDLMSQVNHPNRKGHELVANHLLRWFP